MVALYVTVTVLVTVFIVVAVGYVLDRSA